MDHALIFNPCQNSHFHIKPLTRFNSNTQNTKLSNSKPHDQLLFLRPKHKTLAHDHQLLNTTTTTTHQARHHGRFSLSALPSSSDHDDHDDDDEGNNNGEKIAKSNNLRGSGVGATLALSYVLGILCCGSMIVVMRPQNAFASFYNRFLSRSSSTSSSRDQVAPRMMDEGIITPISGKNTLTTFLQEVLFLTSNPKALVMPYNIPAIGSNEEVVALKKKAIELIKVGKREEALNLLSKKREDIIRDKLSQEKYFIEMAIIEVLIILGEYEKALQLRYLDDGDNIESDRVQRDFYKAIIYTMTGQKDEASKFWQDFEERFSGSGPFS
ncbi:hypothetical protein CsatB_001923 [Cannabis sativa]|uniref:Transmembrane protein n=1 Tax=Cannabis sativa TaxID=3483 RepID=A0A7J6GT16_CANSA|nr:uncharacterized protein LOC115697771 [Cannabis sativa]KAF4360185.1 hypothetical protein F8388_000054 [Cannabis sativa]KAF4386035.1 hypothetical protein G4B88_031170 [Cannabis sativa]